jgi:hypothetical protein
MDTIDILSTIRWVDMHESLGVDANLITDLIVAVVEPRVPNDTSLINECFESLGDSHKIVAGLFS